MPKKYEVTRSVKLSKYPKYDAYLLDRARDIRQQEDHSGPVLLPGDTIANYMGMAAILNFES